VNSGDQAAWIAAIKACTLATSSPSQIALETARKSAPARTMGPQLSGLIPPMATQGISKTVCHAASVESLAVCLVSLVVVG
jgi:hypothetical protein